MTTIYLAHATSSVMIAFFFFNDTATTEIYTLSLHDALPISYRRGAVSITKARTAPGSSGASVSGTSGTRSEEHSLNSSHGYISYAVFCLKKKKKNTFKRKERSQ